MGLRLTTAMALVAAAGILAACNEEDETTVADANGDTVVLEENQADTEMAAGDTVSPDVVVPAAPRVEGATGGELEAAMSTSTGSPAPEAAANAEGEMSNSELTDAQPAENQPLAAESAMPAGETAEAGSAAAEQQQAVEQAANATGDAAAPAADGSTEAASIETDAATQPGTTETADAATADPAAAQPGATETASADAGMESEPLTDEELAALNLDDLTMEDGAGVDRLAAYVENSSKFDATEKTTITAGLEAAKDDPEQMQVLFDQIKEIALNAN